MLQKMIHSKKKEIEEKKEKKKIKFEKREQKAQGNIRWIQVLGVFQRVK